jgi:predicted transcriptional regulator
MSSKLVSGLAGLWVVMTVMVALVPMQAVSEAGYLFREGTLQNVSVDIQLSPSNIFINDTVTIAYNLTNPTASNISIDFIVYAGWGNILGNGTGAHIPAFGSYAITAQWTPLKRENLEVGINATDEYGGAGAGLLVAVINTNVQEKPVSVLTANITLPSTVYANETTLITIDIHNSHQSYLDDLQYSIFAGLGNYIRNGTCPGIPSGGNGTVSANWTPPAPGTYFIGINLSDDTTLTYLDQAINVTVLENGTGPANALAAVVSVPETVHYIGNPVDVTVVYSNTGPDTIYSIQLVICAGWGNNLLGGTGGIDRLAPGETAVRAARWVPTAAGVYPVGTNASDTQYTNTVVAYINVTITDAPESYSLVLSQSPLAIAPGGQLNFNAILTHTGPQSRMLSMSITTFYNGTQMTVSYSPELPQPHDNFTMTGNETRTQGLLLEVPKGEPAGTTKFNAYVRVHPLGWMVASVNATVIVDPNAQPAKLADLSVSALEMGLTPNPVSEGTPCSVIVTVRNVGSANATGSVSVKDIAGGSLGTQNASIAPARAVNLTFAWNPSAGNHTIEVTVTTLGGGNANGLNDVATKAFYILPKSPLPPLGRLRLVASEDRLTISPGGTVVVTVHIICENAMVQGVYLTAVPSSGLTLSIEVLSPPGDLRSGDNWTAKLKIFAPPGIGNATHKGTVQVTVHGVGITGDSLALHVTVVPEDKPQSETVVVPLSIAAVASVAVVAAAVIGGTEIGIIALTALFLPLYVKLRKEEVLDQFTRGKIQGYITAYPGEHYSSIKAQLGLKNGALAYHLKVLEREGYITSVRDGVFKRFYPKEAPLPRRRSQYSAIQEMILEHIKEKPGISQDRLAQMMKVSNQVINYHIKNLLATGAIKLERQGKETRCFLARVWDMGS